MTQLAAGFGNEDLRALGQRLRHLREQRQWSLKRLAQESEVSVAAIRKIELGQSNPSLLTILSLVEALGESIDRLIAAARDGDVRISITRASGQARKAAETTDRTRDLTDPAMRCSVVSVPAGRRLADAGDREAAFGYVLDGAVSVTGAEDDAERCAAGDAFHVASLSRFRLRSAGGKRARLILVTASAKDEADTEATADQHD